MALSRISSESVKNIRRDDLNSHLHYESGSIQEDLKKKSCEKCEKFGAGGSPNSERYRYRMSKLLFYQ